MENQTTPLPTQEPIPNPVPSPAPIRNKNWMIIVFSLLLLILFASIAFLFYQNIKLQKQIVTLQTTPTPTPTTTLNPTANWKTYTNTTGGYSIKYPSTATFKAAEKPSISLTYIGPEQVKSGKTQTELFDGYKITIDIIHMAPGETAQSDAAYQNKHVVDGCPNPSIANVSEVEAAKIDGRTAYHYTLTNCFGDSDIYFVQNSDNMYSISLLFATSTATQKKTYNQTLNQILSTFTFVGTTPTTTITALPKATLVSTVGWNKSSAITFSMLYPPEYSPFSSGDSIMFRHTQNPEQVAVFGVFRDGDPKTAKPYSVYSGGPRRDWWIKSQYDDSHPQPANLKFVEKMMGNIDGLEIYVGESLQTILVSLGSKLYQINGQNEIIKVQTLETITSTLTFH